MLTSTKASRRACLKLEVAYELLITNSSIRLRYTSVFATLRPDKTPWQACDKIILLFWSASSLSMQMMYYYKTTESSTPKLQFQIGTDEIQILL